MEISGRDRREVPIGDVHRASAKPLQSTRSGVDGQHGPRYASAKREDGVRYSQFALVAILAPICGCAVTQPASTPASSSAPPTSELTVVSGERQRIDFISVLNPDCSSAGYVTVRVIAPPAHGELITEKGIDYPTYPKDNQRYQCNLKKVPLVNVYYRSIPGYVGVDTVTIEWISPVIPVAKNRTITIAVR